MVTSLTIWARRHQLITFFVLAYAINYITSLTYLTIPGLPYRLIWIFQIFSPTIAGFIVAALIGGQAEVRRLLAGYTRWDIGLKWYLAGFLLFLVPLLFGFFYILFGGEHAGVAPGLTLSALAGTILLLLISGPIAEEGGWRGFALPRMQSRHGALTSSIVLGIIWAFWHIPFYLTSQGEARIPFLIFIPVSIVLAILLTWIYNNTHGSLPACILAHFSFNLCGALISGSLGMIPPMTLQIFGGITITIWAILIVVVAGPIYFSRKPISELPFTPTKSVPHTRAAAHR